MVPPLPRRGFTLAVAVLVLCLGATGSAMADDGRFYAKQPSPFVEGGTLGGATNASDSNASVVANASGLTAADTATSGTSVDAGSLEDGITRLDAQNTSGPSGLTGGTDSATSSTADLPSISDTSEILSGEAPFDLLRRHVTGDDVTGSSGESAPVLVDGPDDSFRVAPVGGSNDGPSKPGLPNALGTVGAGLVLVAAGVRQAGLSLGAGLFLVRPGSSNLLDRLIRFVVPLRYSRYDDSDPLDHDTRCDVYETVESNPGLYLSAVAEQANLPLSTARHHARVLEREGLLASAKVRGKRRFYPDGNEDVELSAAIDDKPTASVLDALWRHGTCSVAKLADDLDRDPSTVTHHLQRLESEGLVVRERDGRSVVNRLAMDVREALNPDTTDDRRAVVLPADD